MPRPEFEYGPLARGAFIALASCAPVFAMLAPAYLPHYFGFLVFLLFGLRPLLVVTGLHSGWNRLEMAVVERWDRKFVAKRRREIETKTRVEQYKRSRVRDPRLPKNW